MAEATYQIRVRDHSGAQVAVFVGGGRERGGLQSLTYLRRVRTPGGSDVRIDGLDERIDYLLMDNDNPANTGQDFWWEFWRRDPLGGIDWYRDFVAFHRSDNITQDQEGRDTYVARGQGLNILLQAETIRAAVGSAEALKTGAAETVAKDYVDEQIGPGAPAAQQRQGLTIQADAASGAAWEGDRANDNLFDVLEELAEHATADFMIVPTSEANNAIAMSFRWYDGQFGDDRTEGNGVLPPVIFDPGLGNMTNVSYLNSRVDEVNVCYVLGQGNGSLRTVRTVTSGTETDTPWARRSVSRDIRNTNDTGALDDKGNETLNKQRSRRTLEFDARQTPATRYGRDWFLGDLVTVKFRGLSQTKKIVGVRVGLDADGNETIKLECEDI